MIKQLKIKNFKCFNNTKEIELNQITILAGSNGVGKSSVIQSLLLLKQAIINSKKSIETIKLNDIYNLNLGNSKVVTSALSTSEEINMTLLTNKKSYDFYFKADTTATKFSLDIMKSCDINEIFSIFRMIFTIYKPKD